MAQKGPVAAWKGSSRRESWARAEEIADRFEAGERPADLAVRFSLTTNRIRDILARHCGYRCRTGGRGRRETEP
jgi:hypothetical protein